MFARNTYSCPFCLFDIYGVTDYDLIYLSRGGQNRVAVN